MRAGEKGGMTLRPILCALLFALSSPAWADDAPATPAATASPVVSPPPTLDAKEQASLQSFAAAHPECKEWNDGCATCLRDDAIHCSTPGIACLPSAIVCKAP
jgi:hypothetical protein